MSLFRKMRVLVGALVHKPFTPRPEKVDLAGTPGPSRLEGVGQEGPAREAQKPEVQDEDRVADLIARRQRYEGN